ncbi:alkaline phosphatase LapA [Paraburkholderia jirisanensis]
MKFSKTYSAILLSLGMIAASAASAQTVPAIHGGGSSLVAPSINSEIVDFGTTEAIFGYTTASSGVGQAAFLSNDPSQFTLAAGTTIHFANSDAALLATQISAYNATTGRGHTDGPLIQIPYIVTPITIPLVNAPAAPANSMTPSTTPGQTHSVALDDADLCGIFSGRITDWAGQGDSHTNAVLIPGTTTPYTTTSNPITVVYRSDSSGTSELLTRHLSTVCPALSGSTKRADNTTITFSDSTTFANSFPNGVPSNFVGASGSGGVQGVLTPATAPTTSSLIGYLSPDWTNTTLAPRSSSASHELAVASLRNPHTNKDVAPTFTEADNALASAVVPSTPAAAADPTQWDLPSGNPAANPTAGYPVSGTSQIIVSQCYANAAAATAVIDFLNDHYSNATFTSVVNGNGFDVPLNFVSAIQNNFLLPGSGLNISTGGHAGDCKNFAGR